MAQPSRPRRWWTDEEDRVLRREVNIQVKEGGAVHDWNRIATHLPSRSNKDCRKRWTKISGSVKKGAWDANEDARLRAAVARHGLCWTEVAQQVRTRHAEQCAKRWQNCLNPALIRDEWQPADDDRLVKAVETFGRQWTSISEMEFPNRAAADIKNRFELILRKRYVAQRKGSLSPLDGPHVMPKKRIDEDDEDDEILGDDDGIDDSDHEYSNDDNLGLWGSAQASECSAPQGSSISSPTFTMPGTPLDQANQPWSTFAGPETMMREGFAGTNPSNTFVGQHNAMQWDPTSFKPPLLPLSRVASQQKQLQQLQQLSGFPDQMELLPEELQSEMEALCAMTSSSDVHAMTANCYTTSPTKETANPGTAKMTLVMEDLPSYTLSRILDTLYKDKVQYKLDVTH